MAHSQVTPVVVNAWLAEAVVGQPGTSASAQPVLPGMPADASTSGTGGTAQPTGTTGQPGGPMGPTGGAGGKPATGNDFVMFLFWGLMILMIVMLFTSSRAQKREKKKREELMSSLRRNDRVQTIGGLIGTVVELRDDEVVLQGENPGSKYRFSRQAIQQVLKSSGGPAEGAGASGGAGGPASVEVKAGKEGSKV